MGSSRVDVVGGSVVVLHREDPEEISHEVEIVDEVLHSEDGISFPVFLISEPIVAADVPQQNADTHHSILSVARILGSVKNSRTGLTVLDEINAELDRFNDRVLEMDGLALVQNEMKNTLALCFNIVNKIDNKLLKSILEDADISIDTLYQLTETYAMENTYEFIFFLISRDFREQDAEFGAAVASIDTLDFKQLGVSSRFGESLTRAVKKFSKLSALRTPFEKIKCLMQSIRMLSADTTRRTSSPTRSNGDGILSSDVLVPLLVLLVIRSNIQNMPSSLYYMQKFSFEHDVDGGEYGYALSSLEGVISYILSSSAELSRICARNNDVWKALMSSDLESLEAFFESPDAENILGIRTKTDGDGVLNFACRHSNVKVVELLLEKGKSPDFQNYNLETPLHIAAIRGNMDILKALIEHNAHSKQDIRGNSPFLLATEHGNISSIPILFDHDTQMNFSNDAGWTPFHFCQTPETLSILINIMDARLINKRNSEGLTPLLLHCQRGNINLVVALLQLPQVDPTICDFAGRSVLHIASFKGFKEVVEVVVERLQSLGSQQQVEFVNLMSVRGNTALHAGVEQLEIVKALVKGGARAGAKNLEGKVAGDVVRENENVREYLDSLSDGSPFKFAVVSRLLNADGAAMFAVKSLTFVAFESVATVKRPLRSFEFLRYQLLVEFPDTFLPAITGIIALDAPTANLLPRVIRQMVNRLNDFLRYLLSHPLFASHTLVSDFLTLESLDFDKITRESSERVAGIHSTILKYPSTVGSLDDGERYYSSTITAHLNPLARALTTASEAGGKVAKMKRDLCGTLLAYRSNIGNTGFEFLPKRDGTRFILMDVVANLEVLYLKNIVPAGVKLAEVLFDSAQSMGWVSNTLSRYSLIGAEYTRASRESTQLSLSVTRLERLAQATDNDDTINKLSEAHFQFTESLKVTQAKACKLNYTDMNLKSELVHFHSYRDSQLQRALDSDGLHFMEKCLNGIKT
ncbi:hypothetical protein BDR26DRAFT_857991 [Obelidium mucronatum]|nr:hypothetical protein BDR26DRAFT_857991 [Obelidium mucronatum]